MTIRSPEFLPSYIESAQRAHSLEDIHHLSAALAAEAEADYFLHAMLVPLSLVKPKVQIISGFPPAWRAHYNQQGYMAIDPTIRHCLRKVTPITWDTVGDTPRTCAFMTEAAEHGLKSGVSIPLHGQCGESGMLSLAYDRDHKASRRSLQQGLPLIHAVLPYLHETALRLCTIGVEIGFNGNLTPREKECLLWTAEGKTAWEIGIILSITERTVVAHLQAAAQKLGVVNRSHAVARAVLHRLIDIKL